MATRQPDESEIDRVVSGALSGLAAAVMVLGAVTGTAGATWASTASLTFEFPKSIAGLPLTHVEEYRDPTLGRRADYKVGRQTLSVYVYTGDAVDLPDGTESVAFRREFAGASMVAEIPFGNEKTEIIHQGAADMGTPPDVIPAREVAFRGGDEVGHLYSYLCLAALRGNFLKIRYTVPLNLREAAEKNLPVIRRAVGALIRGAKPVNAEPEQDRLAWIRSLDPATVHRMVLDAEQDPLGEKGRMVRPVLGIYFDRPPYVVCLGQIGPLITSKNEAHHAVFWQIVIAGNDFILQHPERAKDRAASSLAGLESGLRAYDRILKDRPDGRHELLDRLVAMRAQDRLLDYVKANPCDEK